MAFHLRLLGGASLDDGEGVLTGPMTHRHRIALLSVLALSRSPVLGRDRLVELLWSDRDRGRGRNLLNQAVHTVRKGLGRDAIVSVTDALRLKPGALECDAVRFREAVEAEHPHRAVELYVGRFMDGFHVPGAPEFDAWMEVERARLQRAFESSLRELAEDATVREDWNEAVEWWRRLATEDPVSADVTLRLIAVMEAKGDRGGAIQQAREHLRLLEEELGAGPDPQVIRALERLRTAPRQGNPPDAQEEGRQGGGATSSNRVHRLVGRRLEWRRLREAWDATLREGPRVALISGEAGIGKTRLAEELLHWAVRRGIPTARSRAYAAEGSLSFAPVADWLRTPILREGLADLEPPWVIEVARLLPELTRDRPEMPVPEPLTEGWQRQRFFAALARAVVAGGGPRVLLIDDLQWCDGDTLQWLRYLVRFEGRAPLLLVGTARSEEVPAGHPLHVLLLDLRREGLLTEIGLGPLSAEETGELASEISGRTFDPKAVSRLHRESEGSPLFVVEMVRARLPSSSGRETAEAAGSWALEGPARGGEVGLPPRVQAVIQFRLAQLSPAARRLSGAAGALGRDFCVELLERTDEGEDEAAFLAGLDELCHRRILRAYEDGRYDFSHDRLREVAYQEMGAPRRLLLHRRAARALEAVHGPNLDGVAGAVAAHYELGGLPKRAIPYYRQAARVAMGVMANQEAVEHLAHGLTLLRRLPRTAARDKEELSLQTALSLALRLSRGWAAPELGEALARAGALAERMGDPELHFQVLVELQSFEFVRGTSLETAWTLLDELRTFAQARDGAVHMVAYHFQAGSTSCQMGKFDVALAHLERAGSLYDPARHRAQTSFYGGDFGVLSNCFAAHVLWHLGRPEEALCRSEQALGLARELEDPFNRTIARAYDTMVRQFLGDGEAVAKGAEETMALSREHGFDYYHAWGTILRGWAHAAAGQARTGIDSIRRGLDTVLATGAELRGPYYLGLLAEATAKSGQPEEALALVDQALAKSAESGERWRDADLLRLRGEYLLARTGTESPGEAACREAEAAFREAMMEAGQQGARLFELRAALSLYHLLTGRGREPELRGLLEPLLAKFGDGSEPPELKEGRALLERLA